MAFVLQAKEAATELGDERMEAALTGNLGAISIVTGDCAAGLAFTNEAIELARGVGSEYDIALGRPLPPRASAQSMLRH